MNQYKVVGLEDAMGLYDIQLTHLRVKCVFQMVTISLRIKLVNAMCAEKIFLRKRTRRLKNERI